MTTCGITNLGSCLVEKFFEFLIYVLNMPIKALLGLINELLTQPVSIEIFSELWAVIIYILSLFYGLLMLTIGVRFLVSGYSPEQRDKAKRSLSNVIIMMILIQISFFLYSLALDLTASLTASVFNMIGSDFFLLTLDNIGNIGLEMALLIPYIMSLVTTLILLTLRYLCVSTGVILFTIAIFFYFIEPLNQYGRLILNYLFVLILLPFFYSIIFLASSMLLELELFENMKILLMIGSFSMVNLMTFFLVLFVIIKAANAISQPVGMITKLVGA